MAIINDYLEIMITSGFPNCLNSEEYIFKADDENEEAMLRKSRAELLNEGFNDLDIDLYLSTLRLDYQEVKHLLGKGANPSVSIGGFLSASDFVAHEKQLRSKFLENITFSSKKLLDENTYTELFNLGAYEKMNQIFYWQKRNKDNERGKRNNLFLEDLRNVFGKYIKHLPKKCDKVFFTYDYPEAGWIDMYFYKKRKVKNYISLSYVKEPFSCLIKWLEQIAEGQKEKHHISSSIVLDTDYGEKQVFVYQPLWTYPYGINYNTVHPSSCGIFCVYDETENRMIFDAYCETSEFIRVFYKSLLQFARKTSTQQDFINAWIWDAYNDEVTNYEDDSPEQNALFYNKVHSEKVEEYLKRIK